MTVFRNPIDADAFAEGMSRPGIDPREWASYGVVQGDPNDPSTCVSFDEMGQPLVSVMLHPSLREVRARVSMKMAGNGEAEWHPFLPGDEVITISPNGNPREGCAILGKFSNELDPFPTAVAGQDVTKNNFAFRRSATPHIEEYQGPVMIRSAKSGGFLSIDDAGVVTIRGGGASPTDPAPALQLSPDVIGLQGPGSATQPPLFTMQVNMTDEVFLLLVRDATLTIASSQSSKQSMLATPAAFAVSAGSAPPLEHVATTEAVANIGFQVLGQLAAFLATLPPGPLTGATLSAAIGAWLLLPFGTPSYSTAFPLAQAMPLIPQVIAALEAAFAAPQPKPAGTGVQPAPGIGCPGFLAG
jgi:hypothetical protein